MININPDRLVKHNEMKRGVPYCAVGVACEKCGGTGKKMIKKQDGGSFEGICFCLTGTVMMYHPINLDQSDRNVS